MKIIMVLAFGSMLLPLHVQAASRYNSQTMTCESVQATLRREGAAIFAYRGRNNTPLYDRYVAHSGFCEGNDITRVKAIPARDTDKCIVYRCFEKSHDR